MDKETLKKRRKKIFKFLFLTLPIIVLIFVAILIAALKMAERYPEPLRQGFEQHLSQSTGTNATIGQMEKFTFFPNIHIRIRDLTMHNRSNAAIIDAQAEYIDLAAPLWSLFSGNNRLKVLSVKNFRAEKGLVTPQAIEIETAHIVDKNGPDQYGSFIVIKGRYAGRLTHFEAEIEKKQNNYLVPKQMSFSLTVGSLTLNSLLDKGFMDVMLKNTVFSVEGRQSPAHDYILVKSGEYTKNNPLSCMIEKADSQDCHIYLEPKDLTQ